MGKLFSVFFFHFLLLICLVDIKYFIMESFWGKMFDFSLEKQN